MSVCSITKLQCEYLYPYMSIAIYTIGKKDCFIFYSINSFILFSESCTDLISMKFEQHAARSSKYNIPGPYLLCNIASSSNSTSSSTRTSTRTTTDLISMQLERRLLVSHI